MIEIKVALGQDAFEHGHYVYVWLDGKGKPIYVGETGKSPVDRAGLHIRDISRSGAVISRIIQERRYPTQQYTILAFPIGQSLLEIVTKENGAANSAASYNRARKALERTVYDKLITEYPDLHKARGCSWKAKGGAQFAKAVLKNCQERETHEA